MVETVSFNLTNHVTFGTSGDTFDSFDSEANSTIISFSLLHNHLNLWERRAEKEFQFAVPLSILSLVICAPTWHNLFLSQAM